MTLDATRYAAEPGGPDAHIRIVDPSIPPPCVRTVRWFFTGAAAVVHDDAAATAYLARAGYTVVGQWEPSQDREGDPFTSGANELGEIAYATVEAPDADRVTEDAIAATVKAMVAGEEMSGWISHVLTRAHRIFGDHIDEDHDYNLREGSWEGRIYEQLIGSDTDGMF